MASPAFAMASLMELPMLVAALLAFPPIASDRASRDLPADETAA